MIVVTLLDAQGIPFGTASASTLADALANVPDGSYAAPTPPPTPDHRWDFGAWVWAPLPVRPGPFHNWNGTSWVDPRPLEDIKAERWAKIKQARDAQEFGGFATPYGRFDSDQKSVANIMGAAMAANAIGTTFTIDYTREDNTAVTLNQAQMIEVGMLLAQHKSAAYAHGRMLRSQIEAATTAEQVQAVVW